MLYMFPNQSQFHYAGALTALSLPHQTHLWPQSDYQSFLSRRLPGLPPLITPPTSLGHNVRYPHKRICNKDPRMIPCVQYPLSDPITMSSNPNSTSNACEHSLPSQDPPKPIFLFLWIRFSIFVKSPTSSVITWMKMFCELGEVS